MTNKNASAFEAAKDVAAVLAPMAGGVGALILAKHLLMSKKEQEKIDAQTSRELRDPRLYSNIRHALKPREEAVRAHKNLDLRKSHTVWSAMKEGFGNKLSHIEPNVFSSFAKEMVEAAARETPHELDELDPNSPYRDSALHKAVGTDRTRTGQAEVPRGDYSRSNPSAKTAGSPLLARLVAAHTGRGFQKKLENTMGGEEEIPGSFLLTHEGIKRDRGKSDREP